MLWWSKKKEPQAPADGTWELVLQHRSGKPYWLAYFWLRGNKYGVCHQWSLYRAVDSIAINRPYVLTYGISYDCTETHFLDKADAEREVCRLYRERLENVRNAEAFMAERSENDMRKYVTVGRCNCVEDGHAS